MKWPAICTSPQCGAQHAGIVIGVMVLGENRLRIHRPLIPPTARRAFVAVEKFDVGGDDFIFSCFPHFRDAVIPVRHKADQSFTKIGGNLVAQRLRLSFLRRRQIQRQAGV